MYIVAKEGDLKLVLQDGCIRVLNPSNQLVAEFPRGYKLMLDIHINSRLVVKYSKDFLVLLERYHQGEEYGGFWDVT